MCTIDDWKTSNLKVSEVYSTEFSNIVKMYGDGDPVHHPPTKLLLFTVYSGVRLKNEVNK